MNLSTLNLSSAIANRLNQRHENWGKNFERNYEEFSTHVALGIFNKVFLKWKQLVMTTSC